MEDLDIISALGGPFLLLMFSTLLMTFQSSLVKLRYQAVDSQKLSQLRKSLSISRLLDKSGDVVRVIRLALIGSTLILGTYLYPITTVIVRYFNIDWQRNVMLAIVAIVLFCLLSIQYFISDLLLNSSGGLQPERFLRVTARCILALTKIVSPFAKVLQFVARQLLTLFGVNFSAKLSPVDASVQLSALGHPDAAVSPEVQKFIKNALRLSDLDVSDVLLPRNQIHYLNIADSVSVNLDRIKDAGHTRFPLCQGDIDHCVGIIHIKDLFLYQGDLESIDLEKFSRQLITFKEDTPLEEALKKLMHLRIHMALVVDEFGGVVGAITLERLLEELVGRIQDEFDFEDSLVVSLSDNTYKVSGLAPIHEVESILNVQIAHEEDVSTFGGLITAQSGKVPDQNEIFEVGDMSVRITEVSTKGIASVTVHVRKRDDQDGGTPD